MKRKLYINALITSPIISIYECSPIYIFSKIPLNNFPFLIFVLIANMLFVWAVHIYFALKFPKQNNIVRFTTTYLANVVLRLVFLDRIPIPKIHEFDSSYIAYPIITSFAINAIVMMMVNSIVTSYKKAQTEKELQDLKLQSSEAQKQILIQQLQPHFLFNSLSTLKSLIGENVQMAEDYTVKLSDFLRYSIQANQNEIISLEKELQFVQDYIYLQKMRFDNAFEYSINIPKNLLKAEIPVFSLQTLVENIFKHNYFTEKNKLQFSIESTGDKIKVTNTKTAIKVTEKTNTGLQNLNKRYLLILNHPILIENTENAFSVTIPLIIQ